MTINAATTVAEALQRYPFLLEFLAGYRPALSKLRNPLLRNTMGRVATLETVARLAGVPVEQLLSDLEQEIGARGLRPGEYAPQRESEEGRLAALKSIILDLHRGLDLETAKQRFGELVKDVDHNEIAAMEQQLMLEGLPGEEIKRLCDVHVALVREPLVKEAAEAHPEDDRTPPGHPLHRLRAENGTLEETIAEARSWLAPDCGPAEARVVALQGLLPRLEAVEQHYLSKENELFPALERYGFEGPTRVMWATHDDIRGLLKDFRRSLAGGVWEEVVASGERLLTALSEMIFKEERILFPVALDLLDEQDWSRLREGNNRDGKDAAGLDPVRPGEAPGRLLPLDTGLLTVDQVDLLLRHLPLDLSFIDEDDAVRYYSEGDRIFPRSPGVIGRKVQNCHPPKSLPVVQRILDEFRSGARDVAEFWLEHHGRFVHIRYFAVRGPGGEYRGALEMVQDVTAIRNLSGEKRLLE